MSERFDDKIAAVLREAELRSPTKSDCWFLMADWTCRTVVPMALEAAERWDDAAALREAPAITGDSDHAWAQRLRDLSDALSQDDEIASYERGDYRMVITVLDEGDCPLAVSAEAVERTIGCQLSALTVAARVIRQLVGPAVVDFDHARYHAFSLPDGIYDGKVFHREAVAQERYDQFFKTEDRLLASLTELFGSP